MRRSVGIQRLKIRSKQVPLDGKKVPELLRLRRAWFTPGKRQGDSGKNVDVAHEAVL